MGKKTISEPNKGGVKRYNFGKHDLFWQYRFNPSLRAIIDTGNYIFIDGRLCLKSPDCFSVKKGTVTVNISSDKALNDYCVARVSPQSHLLDDTTVVVEGNAEVHTTKPSSPKERIYVGRGNRYGGAWRKRTHGFRCRKSTRDTALVRRRRGTYIHAQKHQTLSSIDMQTFLDFTSGGGEPPNGTFGQGVKFYIKREGITQAILAERIGVATETISRICRDVYEPPINMAVAVCIGLHLLPFESRKLLGRLGYDFRDSSFPTVRAYMLLIDVFYNEEVYDCNTFLIEKGLKPLTKETE